MIMDVTRISKHNRSGLLPSIEVHIAECWENWENGRQFVYAQCIVLYSIVSI